MLRKTDILCLLLDENNWDSGENDVAKYDNKDVRINSLEVNKKTNIDNYFQAEKKMSMRMVQAGY